jgi:hypothetical protein
MENVHKAGNVGVGPEEMSGYEGSIHTVCHTHHIYNHKYMVKKQCQGIFFLGFLCEPPGPLPLTVVL